MPKIVIFALVGFIVLAGGSVVLLQQMEIGPFAADEVDINKAKKKEPIKYKFVDMEPFIIPIIQGDKVALNLQIVVKIETPEKKVSSLTKKLPILKDAFFGDLFSFIPRYLNKNKELDQKTLERRLKILGRRVMNRKMIKSVVVKGYSEVTIEDSVNKDTETKEKPSNEPTSKKE